jgi:hypothetical protein
MPYVYFVVTPDPGDDGRTRLTDLNVRQEIVWCKFGITTNTNLNTTRTGYQTHNPSHRFLKIEYDHNVNGVDVTVGRNADRGTRTCTNDLGRDLQWILAQKGMTQVGNTEWMNSGSVDTVLRIFHVLELYVDEKITKDNVSGLMIKIFKA